MHISIISDLKKPSNPNSFQNKVIFAVTVLYKLVSFCKVCVIKIV